MENTQATLSGLFKEVYEDNLEKVIPDEAMLQKDIRFAEAGQKLGNKFHVPVRLTRAQGWTLGGTAGGAFDMNSAEPARSQDATIQGVSFVMEETIGYREMKALLDSKGSARKKAFVNATSYLVENMVETASFIKEMQMLYGKNSHGTLTASSGSSGAYNLTFSAATFIPALWAGFENGYIDIYSSGGTKRNTAGTVKVTGVNISTRVVSVQGTDSEMTLVAANDVVHLRGAKENGMTGLLAQAGNTGTLHGIDATSFSMWLGNVFSAQNAALAFSRMMQAMNKIANRGKMGEFTAYVNPRTFTDLGNSAESLRRLPSKGSIEMGTDNISYTTQIGKVTMKPHLLMLPSRSLVLPLKKVKRYGASDTTFNIPGGEGDVFVLQGKAGWGIRCFWDEAPMLRAPHMALDIQDIVNSDDV